MNNFLEPWKWLKKENKIRFLTIKKIEQKKCRKCGPFLDLIGRNCVECVLVLFINSFFLTSWKDGNCLSLDCSAQCFWNLQLYKHSTRMVGHFHGPMALANARGHPHMMCSFFCSIFLIVKIVFLFRFSIAFQGFRKLL